MDRNSSKIVLITGTSSGIGRVTAETLARAGHTVYASMRNTSDKNHEAARLLQRQSIRAIDLDVTRSESVQHALDYILKQEGRVDVLVNNAGVMPIGVTEAFDDGQAQEYMDINFLGPVRLCRAALPHMRRQRDGLIVNVTSIAGRLIMPGCGLYCASKFALEAYCEALHYELTGSGVECVIVEPGPFPTQLFANSPVPKDVERVEAYGPLAGVRTLLLERFREMFASAQSLSPQQVADEIERLIGLPQSFRRLRTICGPDFGASALNDRAAYVQAELLCAMGMPEMAAAASQVEEVAA